MTENVENLLLEMLRRIDGRLTNIEGDMRDIKLRTTITEEHLGSVVTSMAGLNGRMDRFDERLTRVERRLELSDVR
jgi:hypothetical protein